MKWEGRGRGISQSVPPSERHRKRPLAKSPGTTLSLIQSLRGCCCCCGGGDVSGQKCRRFFCLGQRNTGQSLLSDGGEELLLLVGGGGHALKHNCCYTLALTYNRAATTTHLHTDPQLGCRHTDTQPETQTGGSGGGGGAWGRRSLVQCAAS